LNAIFTGRARAPGPGPVIAFVDPGREAANAAWRAALVARDRGLDLHLIGMLPLHANLVEASRTARLLADEVRARLDLDVSAQAIAGTLDREGVEAARRASLVVVPPVRSPWPWSFGSHALRMLRRSGRPVLLARRPAQASYRSVLAAVELELDACSLIAAAHALSRDPSMKVLHVLDTAHEETLRLADVPVGTIREQRERDAARASRVLTDLIAAAGAAGDAQPVVSFGPVDRAVVAREFADRADLLVVGKRPRHALVDALLGGATQVLLRKARADVLVLPMPPRAPAASWQLPEFAGVPAR
jgi:nucleotide-binding universal stress UspA family protein